MESTAVESVTLPGSVTTDMSIVGLFLSADIIVKIVMVMLFVASFWSWTIIFEKVMRFARLRSQAEKFEDAFWSGGSLEDLYDRVGSRPDHPMAAVFASAMTEWRRAVKRGMAIADDRLRAGLQQRIGQAMQVTLDRELERLERYLGVLATVGSTAPFVGLFGTVWGIMNSFQAIALSKDTSLAVVAPGIAEALFATALGLVAAIPAVIGYNKLSADLDRYGSRLEHFSAEFHSLLSRQLDEKGA
ncbi:MAG: protein TolQ [Alphaproteobacteria bacterium]|nr:protein TolQ [Alphaproteobacteria bacterium]